MNRPDTLSLTSKKDDWLKQHHATLYDPLEDKMFGHMCSYSCHNTTKNFLNLPDIEYQSDYRDHDDGFRITVDNKTQTLYISTRLIVFERDSPSGDLNCYDLVFNPLLGDFVKYKSTYNITNWVYKPFNNYWIDKDFLAHCTQLVDQHEYYSFPPLHDISLLLQLDVALEKDSHVAIIQPKISSSPKTLDVGFTVTNVVKHPTEPLLIVNNDTQYAVIDLDI
jgi:hypothetical protein